MTRLWIVALMGSLSLVRAADRPISVILDTDIDDALALGLALQSPEQVVSQVNV